MEIIIPYKYHKEEDRLTMYVCFLDTIVFANSIEHNNRKYGHDAVSFRYHVDIIQNILSSHDVWFIISEF